MNEEECDQLYNSQFESMEFSWLEEVREWVNKTYNTRLLTIAFSVGKWGGKRFFFYFYNKNDKIPRIYYADGGAREDMSDINHKIAEVSGLEEGSFDSVISRNFVSQWKRYLIVVKKEHDLSDQIKAFFKNVNVIELLHCNICVMATKVKAGEFLLSEEYKIIKKKIYDLLKSYDKYNLLEEKDVTLFVDYKEHMDKISMYGRWVDYLTEDEMIEYENGLINAYIQYTQEENH